MESILLSSSVPQDQLCVSPKGNTNPELSLSCPAIEPELPIPEKMPDRAGIRLPLPQLGPVLDPSKPVQVLVKEKVPGYQSSPCLRVDIWRTQLLRLVSSQAQAWEPRQWLSLLFPPSCRVQGFFFLKRGALLRRAAPDPDPGTESAT